MVRIGKKLDDGRIFPTQRLALCLKAFERWSRQSNHLANCHYDQGLHLLSASEQSKVVFPHHTDVFELNALGRGLTVPGV